MPFIVSLASTALSLKTLFWRAAVILKYLIPFSYYFWDIPCDSLCSSFSLTLSKITKNTGAPSTLQPREHLPPSGLESFSSPFITSENYSRLASCHYTELLKGNQSLDDAGGNVEPTDWCRNQTGHYQRRNWRSIYKLARKKGKVCGHQQRGKTE